LSNKLDSYLTDIDQQAEDIFLRLVNTLPQTEETPEGYKEISFVCLRPDGAIEAPLTMNIRKATRR